MEIKYNIEILHKTKRGEHYVVQEDGSIMFKRQTPKIGRDKNPTAKVLGEDVEQVPSMKINSRSGRINIPIKEIDFLDVCEAAHPLPPSVEYVGSLAIAGKSAIASLPQGQPKAHSVKLAEGATFECHGLTDIEHLYAHDSTLKLYGRLHCDTFHTQGCNLQHTPGTLVVDNLVIQGCVMEVPMGFIYAEGDCTYIDVKNENGEPVPLGWFEVHGTLTVDEATLNAMDLQEYAKGNLYAGNLRVIGNDGIIREYDPFVLNRTGKLELLSPAPHHSAPHYEDDLDAYIASMGESHNNDSNDTVGEDR